MVWLLVGTGGALGAMGRYALSRFIHQQTFAGTFPAGIFVVNVLGSWLIGILGGLALSGRWPLSLETRTFLIVGVLGGFTTFSTFSFDTLTLVRDGHLGYAIWNVTGQVTLSLIAVWIGFRVGAAL